ncbi:MAG: helix-turn-helix transcriptional regulator [Neobacillus sp.]|jgi:transcriptional regulator with XRE-family HTH domain
MLGERIRQIRKSKKMTLEALAGAELTKGMLSLIENNKANPSMESLNYIAKRLGVEITDLLEEVSSIELRDILEKAEKLFNTDQKKLPDKHKQLITLIEPHISNLPQGYEGARLLDIFGRSLCLEKQEGWENYYQRAAAIYDDMNLTAKRAGIGIFRAMVKFIEHHYSDSLHILLSERGDIEARHAYMDPMTRVDFDYHEAILHFATGDSTSAEDVMEKAIQYSKEHRIYYRIDDLYRLACLHAIMKKDLEKKNYYQTKLKLFGEFAEDQNAIVFYDFFEVMCLISEDQNYRKALEIIETHLLDPKMEEYYGLWYPEKGKALYGLGKFAEALHYFDKVEIPDYAHHPFDLSLLYIVDSYKALCHMEMENAEEAVQLAKRAVENLAPLPDTLYKNFAIDTYHSIKTNIR